MEGDLIADEDVDGVALNAVLLLFLLLRAEGKVRGPTPLPGRVAVRRRLHVERSSQLPVGPGIFQGDPPDLEVAGLFVLLHR